MPVAIRPIIVLDYTMPSAANHGADYVATRPLVVIDHHNQCTVAGANGTSQLLRQALGSGGFNPITAALAMETANALVRTANLITAQNIAQATDVLRLSFVSGAGTGVGRAWVKFTPTAISGQ